MGLNAGRDWVSGGWEKGLDKGVFLDKLMPKQSLEGGIEELWST